MLKKNFKIDSFIYDENIIKSSIDDFKEVTDILYNNWVLEIHWNNEEEIEEIFLEFMNYFIWVKNELT